MTDSDFGMFEIADLTITNETIPSTEERTPAIFKKWFKTKSRAGFISLTPWFNALKISVDIGEVVNGKVTSNTLVWTDIIGLTAFLKSIANGTSKLAYGDKEEYSTYGGARIDGKPVSRILKVHQWEKDGVTDAKGFAWKTGHFAARQSDSGAYIPDMTQKISTNLIKVTRQEMHDISLRLELGLHSFASQNSTNWFVDKRK